MYGVQSHPPNGNDSDDDKITSFDESFVEDEPKPPIDESRTKSQVADENEPQIQQNERRESLEGEAEVKKGFDDVAKTLDRVTPDGVANQSTSKMEPDLDSSCNPPSPYLITLQGNEDNLIHSLDKQEVLIGSDVTDFKLMAPDILRHHCVIKKRLEIVFSEKGNDEAVKRWIVTINPLNPVAEVRINGGRISSKHALQHGEMVSVGKHHLFMFKDPSSHINLSSLVNLSYLQSTRDSDNCSTEAHGSNTSLNTALSPRIQPQETAKLLEQIETLLNYRADNEDEILKTIFNYVKNFDNPPQKQVLFPATLLCHCIFHSCLNFDLQLKNDVLLKIASTMQTLVLVSLEKQKKVYHYIEYKVIFTCYRNTCF